MFGYLDGNASSTIRPEVSDGLCLSPGNPSSIHKFGQNKREILSKTIDSLTSYSSLSRNGKVIFTSGGTESCNLAVFCSRPRNVICSKIEHEAVIQAVNNISDSNEVTWISPGSDGIVRASDYLAALKDETDLVVLMGVNNETGAIQPVPEIAKSLRLAGYSGLIFSDMVQVVGKVPNLLQDSLKSGVNLVALSGHKTGALPGSGALLIEDHGVCRLLSPMQFGGNQQHSLRPGTENYLAIQSLGLTFDHLLQSEEQEFRKYTYLKELLLNSLEQIVLISPEKSSPGTVMARVPGIRADDLVVAMDLQGFAISAGSACASGKPSPSHVLLAQGYSDSEALEAIRVSFDWSITEKEILAFADSFNKVVTRFIQRRVA